MVKEGEKGLLVDEIVVDFGGGEMRVVEDDGNVDVFFWEFGEGLLVDVSDVLLMKSEKIWWWEKWIYKIDNLIMFGR